jgi:uncharacterized protein YqjF (DUF2071 family)
LVPPSLEIQEFDGTTWVGLVPFRMTGVSPRLVPNMPWVSAFPEMNLRLYVEHLGQAGVWFVSLDAANPMAVWVARKFFHLPYFHARMQLNERGERVEYSSDRIGGTGAVRFAGSYQPTGPVYHAKPGTLEHFLTERYCLYTQTASGALLRGHVHHVPWPLQPAELEIAVNEVATPQGLPLEGPPALVHFSRRLDVVLWPFERVPTT